MRSAIVAIGTRGSPLALVQVHLAREALSRAGRRSRIVIVETQGDRRAPDAAWGEGAFVAAIERALLSGHVDVAVHSAKDIPTEEHPGLLIAAYLPRADPRDGLVVAEDAHERRVADLAAGARVGTDSPRRAGFLLARRPDLLVHPLHGNVDTRLRRLDAGETDALVLACAGLDRLGLGDRIAERIDPETIPPAPGQGAIAIQVRRGDARMRDLVAGIDDRRTRLEVESEREFLRTSGGGCRAPIGAVAAVAGADIDLLGGYATPTGSHSAIAHRRGPSASAVGLARELARELDPMRRLRAADGSADRNGRRSAAPRVLVTRPVEQAGELVAALREAGLDPVTVPTIEVVLAGGELDRVVRRLATYRWVGLTSPNGARAILAAARRLETRLAGPSWAAVGAATRRELEGAGLEVSFQPAESRAAALAAELPVLPGDRVLLVRGDLAERDLAEALRGRGAVVEDVVGYRTREAPKRSRALLRAAAAGPIAAVVFTSGSTVRGLLALGQDEAIDVLAVPAVCIGPPTADAARRAGFAVLAVAPTPDVAAIAGTTARALAADVEAAS